MAIKFTDAQTNAINADGSIVVYAAAGSGKTAVLTQRVKRLICDEQNPIDADRILVVTFTKAAAAEMKGRIIEAVNKEVEQREENGTLSDHILRQQMLISAANICTVDSFCANLLKENFETVGIDPDFKVADELKVFEVSRNVIKDMVAEKIATGDENFKLLGDAIGIDSSLSGFSNVITSIYDKSRSLPRPEVWLRKVLSFYGQDGNITGWTDEAFSVAKIIFESLETLVDTYLHEISDIPEGYKCAEQITGELSKFTTEFSLYLDKKDWDGAKYAIDSAVISTISQSVKKVDVWLYDHLRGLRVEALDIISRLASLFEYDINENSRLLKLEKRAVEALVDFVIEYGERFRSEMLIKGLATFDMVSHTAFSAVCRYDEQGNVIPTEFGKELAGHYDAVLVDEYQDNNSLQDAFFNVISDGGKKLFMVGDAKQSIYGFRNANPENFIRYRDTSPNYAVGQNQERSKVVLDANFRSREGICLFANFLFGAIMQQDPSGMDYTADDCMNSNATYETLDEPSVELHIVDRDKALDSKEIAACHIAEYIKQTMARQPFINDGNGGLRTAKYSDFAILMRSAKDKGAVYADILKQAGIPVSFNSGGIFETTEIMTLHSLLKAIDNPCDDVAILATLTGPVFAMSLDRVAEIRAENKADSFYASLILASSKDEQDVISVFDKLKYLRRMAATMPVAEFIEKLVEESSLREIMSSYGESARRRSNIDTFISLAAEFEADSHLGLSVFLRMLENYSESDKLTSSGNTTDDAVTIMTIHGSKGLEFPICILAEASARFNEKDTFGTVRMSENMGISVNLAELITHKKYEPLSAKLIRRSMHKSLVAEEQRLLYVALTRAKEKLVVIIDGATHNENKLMSFAKGMSFDECKNLKLCTENILSSACYADWILKACQFHVDYLPDLRLARSGQKGTFSVMSFPFESHTDEEKTEDQTATSSNDELVAELVKRFSYSYPFNRAVSAPTKTSVSRLLADEQGLEYAFTRRPAIFAENKMNAAEKGTATHKFMQYADFSAAISDLDAEITRLAEWEYLTSQECEVLDKGAIISFLKSELCNKIQESPLVLKEQKFLVPLNDGEGETVIQGCVDCVFAEGDDISIIDFKTTRFETDAEFINAYSRQLDIYADAMEQVLGMKVVAKYIYSLHLSKTIKL